jgi:hypothetical protein
MKKIDMLNLEKVVFVDGNGVEMVINDVVVEKIEALIEVYHILGHNGEENCSGADVGMEFRYVLNECREKGRDCCSL